MTLCDRRERRIRQVGRSDDRTVRRTRACDENGARRNSRDALGDASEEKAPKAGVPVTADNDKVRFPRGRAARDLRIVDALIDKYLEVVLATTGHLADARAHRSLGARGKRGDIDDRVLRTLRKERHDGLKVRHHMARRKRVCRPSPLVGLADGLVR
jgi:hypothetical protein